MGEATVAASSTAAATAPTSPSTTPCSWWDTVLTTSSSETAGDHWGEGGYIRLARDATAQCGTDSSPMDGTACEGGPGNDEQHVCGQCGVLFDCSWPLGAHEFQEP